MWRAGLVSEKFQSSHMGQVSHLVPEQVQKSLSCTDAQAKHGIDDLVGSKCVEWVS